MRTLIFISLLIVAAEVSAQRTQGITRVADTSYNLQAEYRKLKDKYPQISIPAMEGKQVAVTKNVVYCTAGGKELLLDVFRPAAAKLPATAVVIIHGGGWRSGNRTLHHALAHKLAQLGYVCFTPSYRLSTEALYPAAVQDVKAVVRWVRRNAVSYGVDSNAIAIAGHSAGGELAAFTGATNGMDQFEGGTCNRSSSSRVQAVIDIDGILAFIHPESGEGDDSKRISAATYWFGYSKLENEALWRQGSPLTHVGAHTPPVLFMNSMVDRMHAGQADFIRELDKHGIYNEVRLFRGAPHSFPLFQPWFDSTVGSISSFLDRTFGKRENWSADNGDGTYTNPVIHADYSDPDVVRVGKDYYMVSSSFTNIPGIPILHSRDLVNWRPAGHALDQLMPADHYNTVRHGDGVWAPSIRFHKDAFYIYYPDPEFGIYMIRSKSISGPWSAPVLVKSGKGLIDPCPLWDDDGKAYLVHAYAGSRAGIKSLLAVREMNAEGTKLISEGRIVYDGHDHDPKVEGPKFYKRNGYYYIFAPAGGVATGWQIVLRSKEIYGPYERKVVMDQGSTAVNGPHQGAWIDTENGQDWFIHFQDKKAYGRVVHLQPMHWKENWPVIGDDPDGDGKGQPVQRYPKPAIKDAVHMSMALSDEFNATIIGTQWQWQANAQPFWAFPYEGMLRMFAVPATDSGRTLWSQPSLLMQKLPAEAFEVTTRVSLHPKQDGERAGLIVWGQDYALISLEHNKGNIMLVHGSCIDAQKAATYERKQVLGSAASSPVYLRARMTKGGEVEFGYSTDGETYTTVSEKHIAKQGKWIGAKVGIFCTGAGRTNDPGYAKYDWFRINKLN